MPRLGWGTGKDDDRGRSAPMQGVEYERPMDPGPFQVPNKRQHVEDPTGQTSYIPNPFSSSRPNHLAPGPLLFSSAAPPSSSSAGFSRWSAQNNDNKHNNSSQGGAETVDVDMNAGDENVDPNSDSNVGRKGQTQVELEDVEMYSDSPLKSKVQPCNSGSPEGGPNTDSTSSAASAPASVLRPISLNGSETSTQPPTPTITRRRLQSRRHQNQNQKSGLSASHLPTSPDSQSQPINQYTLNMYHAPGQSMGMGMGMGMNGPGGEARGKSWVDAELPYVFIGYVQFVFNASLTLMILTALFWFLWTIWGDVKDLRGVYSTEILQEISTCTNMYLVNRCEPSTRIPAMESACQEWEHCMNRDPSVVSFTKVGAEVVAGVVGGFVDALSWRSLMALFGLFPLMIILTNSTLLNVRKKHQPPAGSGYPHPHQHHPQQTGPSGYAPIGQAQQLHPGYVPQQAQFHWPPPVMGPAPGQGQGKACFTVPLVSITIHMLLSPSVDCEQETIDRMSNAPHREPSR
ncbi:Di-sulfide bridge nucleocytoplasmic transport domain-containing protein [Filobasidium floriforme]|uniref:Di-sulfide bridge nucleocytoplasmic transport domain-containing protein n=1 Tax=Filobasidium floriforme TaxID=5210 RepID=UPI001E8CA25F|nr:Di-sulfide bridge nucleocytoplasmic transport domain-containing protein [Filobasidium floriforme]KAH8080784.1 Di-sulfide bridge nucleocytoplasmic transport domain-containing protein [Filobasidium floriforme]